MVVVVVEADLPVGYHLLVRSPSSELVVPPVADVLRFMRVYADGGVHEGGVVSQCDGGLTCGEVAPNGHEGLDTGFARARDHHLPVAVVPGIIEVCVSIDEHNRPLLTPSKPEWYESERLGGSGHDHIGQFGEEGLRLVPSEAVIGDRDAVDKGTALFPGLLAGIQVAFQHEPHNRLSAFAELAEDFAG